MRGWKLEEVVCPWLSGARPQASHDLLDSLYLLSLSPLTEVSTTDTCQLMGSAVSSQERWRPPHSARPLASGHPELGMSRDAALPAGAE